VLDEDGYAHGAIIYVDNGAYGGGSWKYLEVADVSAAGTLKNWGSMGTATGAAGTALGAGKENTDLILGNDPTAAAALYCRNYAGGGKHDWYLPNKSEYDKLLSCINDNAFISFIMSSAMITPGGYLFWTSEERSENEAYVLKVKHTNPLSDPTPDAPQDPPRDVFVYTYRDKSDSAYIWPIRRF
jgi:hypothetical protein